MKETITNEPVSVDPKSSDTTAFLLDAVEKANQTYTYWAHNFKNAESNLEYIYGEQYTSEELNEKEEMNRIALTFNKLPQFINKVVGAQRSTVNTIKVSPGGMSPQANEQLMITNSGEEMKESELYTDIIRNIEYNSNAKAWYKMAFKHALEGGFGFLRVLTEYQEFGFDQEIKIAGIRNRWSVLIDPSAQESDMSDMNYCFINERMPRKEFEHRYPNKSYEAMPGANEADGSKFWSTEDTVTVTEYFRREPVTKIIALGSDGRTYDYDRVEGKIDQMADQGIELVKFREMETYKVIWCKISQGDILEKDREFMTTTIPIVPVLGREFDFRRMRRFRGLIDDAIDAQTALNKMRSSALERIDSSPINPFIASDKAIEGYENQWAEANTVKYSTLVYRKGEDRPTREMGATMPTAELQTSQFLDEDMKASIGIFNASLGNKSNEISGKAIEARKQEADVGTYEFLDNYANSIRRVGLLVSELIPQIYDTSRTLQIRSADGTTDSVEVNQESNNSVANALREQRYNIVITSGQSYETRQQESAAQILDLMKVNPKIAEVGGDLLVKNLDFADSDVLAERVRKTIPQDLLGKEERKKAEKEQQEQPKKEPTPEEKIAQMESETKKMELEAKQKESQMKIEMEQIKLEQAKINLETKKVESQMKIQVAEEKVNDNHDKRQDNEDRRRDEVAKGIVEQMKSSTENPQQAS